MKVTGLIQIIYVTIKKICYRKKKKKKKKKYIYIYIYQICISVLREKAHDFCCNFPQTWHILHNVVLKSPHIIAQWTRSTYKHK